MYRTMNSYKVIIVVRSNNTEVSSETHVIKAGESNTDCVNIVQVGYYTILLTLAVKYNLYF